MELIAQEINTIDTSSLDFTPDKKRYIFLAKKDKIDFIYNTSALEGNMMTYPEVEMLLEGITVGGHKLSDEQQILSQNRSVNLLLSMLEENSFNIGGTDYLPPSPDELDRVFDEGTERIAQIEIAEYLELSVMAISKTLAGHKK